MTVRELFLDFFDRSPWVDRADTVDRVRFGDPEREVSRVGTGWSACLDNLKNAVRDRCDLFISHEVPFLGRDGRTRPVDGLDFEAHRALLKESGMALFNLHDSWDHFPVYGVRDALARLLRLDRLSCVLDYIHPGQAAPTTGKGSIGVYEVATTSADGFARHMAACIEEVRAPGLTLMGDAQKPVHRVAIGVGCHVPGMESMAAGADLLVVVYDRAFEQTRIALVEKGAAVIVVEHGVAEMYSMREMARLIRERYAPIDATCYMNEPMGAFYR